MDLSDSDSADPLSPYSPENESLAKDQPKSAFPIECRVTPLWWLRVLMCLVLSALLFTAILKVPSKPSDRLVITLVGAIGLLSGGFAIWMVLELMRSVIRADETGLTWRRSFGGWRSARWEEITDYYRASPVYKSGLIETPAGKVELWHKYAGFERIADLVIEKTPHINNAGWEMKGTRSNENWSRTFSPWSAEQLWAAPCMTGIVILMVFGWLIAPVISENRNQAPLGFWFDTFPLILVTIFGGLLIGGYIWMMRHLWRNWLLAWKHRDEKLVLDANGLVFTSNSHNFNAKWQEIEKISLLPKVNGITQVQVETATANFIVWRVFEPRLWRKIAIIFDKYAAHAMKDGESKN